jgi:short-subunit dehydrogenase
MSGKFMVVTGGTKGIGKAIAEKFAAEGFDIATCARSEQDLNKLAFNLHEQYGGKVFAFCHDISKAHQAKQFVRDVRSIGRPISVLVNNAGGFSPGRLIDEEEGVLERMLGSNLISAYNVTRGLVQDMIAMKGGHIFNLCSVASIQAYPNGGSYSVAKFGLLGFSKNLREELKNEGVKVTAVLPGATYTASWRDSGLPQDRFMKSSDVAEAIFSAYSLSVGSVVEELLIRPQLGDI